MSSSCWSHCIVYIVLLLSTVLPPSLTDHSLTESINDQSSAARVFLAILARNSAHLLPNFLGYVERLDYPKDRISVWCVMWYCVLKCINNSMGLQMQQVAQLSLHLDNNVLLIMTKPFVLLPAPPLSMNIIISLCIYLIQDSYRP